MKILGIYSGHTASACLMIDGKIVCCVSEERFTGTKNQSGFPKHSIEHILSANKLKKEQIDFVVIPQLYTAPIFMVEGARNKDLVSHFLNKIYVFVNIFRNLLRQISYRIPFLNLFREKTYLFLMQTVGKKSFEKEREYLSEYFGISKDQVIGYEHHTAHAASTYFSSKHNEEKTLVLTLDGEGDGLSATVNIAENNKITRIAETSRGNSLGEIYMFLTEYLGMKMLEHEYKVMGLAPYAKEKSVDKLYKKIENIITLDPENTLKFKTKFHTAQTSMYLQKEMRGERFDNIAGAFQKLVEIRVEQWVREAIKTTGVHTICLAGGVFMNVKLNKKIMDMPEVEDLYILPSCSDESLIIGACYLCSIEKGNQKTFEPLKDMYLGPEFSNDDIKKFIQDNNLGNKYKVEYKENIEQAIAELLSKNKVVARLAGRMEFGARALGNRSILANPSDQDVIMVINEQMKDRDFWMPFAPSLLKERANDYIVNPRQNEGKFMILAFDSTELAKKEMRATLHPYDFTCRPQIVDQETNSKYYKLLKEFENITKIGGVLNTSFNLHGFPIVLGPKEALFAFEHWAWNIWPWKII